MKVVWPKEIKQNIRVLMNRLGYHHWQDRRTGQLSYIRRLSTGQYPRFHVYIESRPGEKMFFNLHLDEKKASYHGFSRHSGQYSGEWVEKEAARIINYLKNLSQ